MSLHGAVTGLIVKGIGATIVTHHNILLRQDPDEERHQVKYLGNPQSGSYAQNTASRNRFGQYFRTRAIPVNPNSTFQSQARTRLASQAEIWDTLTDNQRAGWKSLGDQMTRTDSLGQAYSLTGLQAFVSINSTRLAASLAGVTDAPGLATPSALASAGLSTTGGTLSLAYTGTPLPAATYGFIFLSPQRSAGRNFENDYRLIAVTAAAAASPANLLAPYSARFGAPVVGNKIFGMIQTMSLGFLSSPLLFSKVVTA